MASSATQGLKASSHPRWFTVFAALAVITGMIAAFVGYDFLSSALPNKVFGWSGIGAAAASLLAIVVVSGLTKQELTVDADGVEERKRGKTTRIRWSEPHELYYRAFDGSGTPRVEKATVQTADGRRIELDDATVQGDANVKVPKLVEQYSSTANTPKLQARINDGEDVPFGAVMLSRERLRVGELSYSMDAPITLQVENGEIKVGADGGWTESHVSVRDVANYACLLRAIGQVTHARAPV